MTDIIYLHYHYDYDNNRELLCQSRQCYQKRLEDKKKLQEYQDKVDCDLQLKENLIVINEWVQDPRIDNWDKY